MLELKDELIIIGPGNCDRLPLVVQSFEGDILFVETYADTIPTEIF